MKIDCEVFLNFIHQLTDNKKHIEDSEINELLKFLYYIADGNLFVLFLRIDAIDKENHRKREQLLYLGLEQGMHALMGLYGGNKKSKKMILEDNESSVPFIINIAKAYFPDAIENGASELGKNFLKQFKRLVLDSKEYWNSERGKSWLEMTGHTEYINLILNETHK